MLIIKLQSSPCILTLLDVHALLYDVRCGQMLFFAVRNQTYLLFSFFFLNVISMFPKSTHETFAQKLYQTFKNNKRFSKPKLSRTDFTISHYAGEVSMCVPSKDLLLSHEKFLSFLHNLFMLCTGNISS